MDGRHGDSGLDSWRNMWGASYRSRGGRHARQRQNCPPSTLTFASAWSSFHVSEGTGADAIELSPSPRRMTSRGGVNPIRASPARPRSSASPDPARWTGPRCRRSASCRPGGWSSGRRPETGFDPRPFPGSRELVARVHCRARIAELVDDDLAALRIGREDSLVDRPRRRRDAR